MYVLPTFIHFFLSYFSLSNIHSRRRISRIEDDSGPSMGSSGSILNTSRELSVMPGASVANTFENELTASLPSRFANMTTGGSTSSSRGDRNDRTGSNSSAGTMQRGKSLAPTSSSTYGSNGGYSASFGGKSSNYSSSSSKDWASGSKIVHSFPLSVSSKVSAFFSIFLAFFLRELITHDQNISSNHLL